MKHVVSHNSSEQKNYFRIYFTDYAKKYVFIKKDLGRAWGPLTHKTGWSEFSWGMEW